MSVEATEDKSVLVRLVFAILFGVVFAILLGAGVLLALFGVAYVFPAHAPGLGMLGPMLFAPAAAAIGFLWARLRVGGARSGLDPLHGCWRSTFL